MGPTRTRLIALMASLALDWGSRDVPAALPPPQPDHPVTAHAEPSRLKGNLPAQRLVIRKLGTLDLDMVEATPVVFKGRFLRFEYVRKDYHANTTGDSYFRFIDVEAGEATPAFAHGYHLGCAYAEGDSMWAFGVDQWDGI